MKKAIIELNKIPENCLKCPISFYESGDDGESLYCPLTDEDGNYLERPKNCPITIVE